MSSLQPTSPAAVRASVCMASYNGSAYITEQLSSILKQLGPADEVVIVDDASTDGTLDAVRAFGDDRIRLFEAAVNQGYVNTEEAALVRLQYDLYYIKHQSLLLDLYILLRTLSTVLRRSP